MFFERGIQSSTRHRRLKHLVLLALRCALVLLVVLAFANPFVRRVAANTNGRLLLIVLDNSFSMRAGTRFADAKQQAIAKLAAKQPSQKAQIIALGGQLQILTQPIADAAQLRSALESIQPGDGHASFGELGRDSRARRKRAYSYRCPSIQRHAAHRDAGKFCRPGAARKCNADLHSVANKIAPANWTVESVDAPAELSDPKDPHRSRVRAVVAGFSTPAASKTVSLVVNGKVIATRKVEVPANGRATVEFAPLDVNYGFNRCEVRIEGGDALAADDASVFSVRRSDPERVLFVHASGDARSPVYFGAALKAASKSSFVLQSVRKRRRPISIRRGLPSLCCLTVLHCRRSSSTRLLNMCRGGNVFIALGTARHVVRASLCGTATSPTLTIMRAGQTPPPSARSTLRIRRF